MFFLLLFFFFNDTATTEIYTLSLHDALPILSRNSIISRNFQVVSTCSSLNGGLPGRKAFRSEEHTSELQSQSNLVCRLLLEKKKKKKNIKKDKTQKKKNNTYHIDRNEHEHIS